MARPRKVSLNERIKQKRLSSHAPSVQDPVVRAPDVLHVAPLPPLPSIEVPAVVAEPEPVAPPKPVAPLKPAAPPVPVVQPRAAEAAPPPASEMDDEARLELERLIAPGGSLSGRPRRGIALVAGIAVVFGVAIGVKLSRARSHRLHTVESRPAVTAVAMTTPVLYPPPPPPPVSAEPVASASASAQPVASASAQPVASASAQPVASASAAPAASAEPSASASVEPGADSASAATLRDHALDLLKRAKNPEAMAAASAALDADPTDAMPYLVLGSALQDTGRWKEAHRTYELCVKFARKGMLDECRAMLRRR